MPSFFQNGLNRAGIRINDDRGNPLNLPINETTKPSGIYRTNLTSANQTNVMTRKDENVIDYPLGFTPPNFFYILGSQSNPVTGLPVEYGNAPGPIRINDNSTKGKIARTSIKWTPSNASPVDFSGQNSPYTEGELGNNQVSYNSSSVNIPGLSKNYTIINNGLPSNMLIGFTNPLSYITSTSSTNQSTGLPTQFGSYPNNIKPNFNRRNLIFTTPNKKVGIEDDSDILSKKESFDQFNNKSQYDFVHYLDRRIDIDSSLSGNNVYLAGYVSTGNLGGLSVTNTSDLYLTDNEDPTILGYDLVIKWDSSPLFNGAIEDFINKHTNDPEIESRRQIWNLFKDQFFKYFRMNSPNSLLSSGASSSTPTNSQKISTSDPLGWKRDDFISDAKVHYLKKISGIENLVEKEVTNASESTKGFIDYGKDLIKLTIWEDVNINTGYLAHLYKTLSWSRIRGKQIIPENLLRFDIKIQITEIRDFNRVVKKFNSSNELDVYPDLLNKYTYTLYDCQLMFNELSHGSEIDMTSKSFIEDFTIAFNYKFSTLSFDKFNFALGPSQSISGQKFSVDNSQDKPSYISPQRANNISVNNSSLEPVLSNIKFKGANTNYPGSDQYVNVLSVGPTIPEPGTIEAIKKSDDYKEDPITSDSLKVVDANLTNANKPTLDKLKDNQLQKDLQDDLKNKLKSAVIREVNRQITTQARLLNRTLDNIRNSIGLGRMSYPRNVYTDTQVASDIKNAFRDFIGNSVKGFFDPPRG